MSKKVKVKFVLKNHELSLFVDGEEFDKGNKDMDVTFTVDNDSPFEISGPAVEEKEG